MIALNTDVDKETKSRKRNDRNEDDKVTTE